CISSVGRSLSSQSRPAALQLKRGVLVLNVPRLPCCRMFLRGVLLRLFPLLGRQLLQFPMGYSRFCIGRGILCLELQRRETRVLPRVIASKRLHHVRPSS